MDNNNPLCLSSIGKEQEKGILLESKRWKWLNYQAVPKKMEEGSRGNNTTTTNKDDVVEFSFNTWRDYNWGSNLNTK